MKTYIDRMKPYWGKRILEIGAGGGQVAVEIIGLCGPDAYVAVEVRDRLRKEIREAPPKGFSYVLTNAMDLRYNPDGKPEPILPEGRFNLIHGKSWLTHVMPDEFEKYVKLIVARLVPGGHLAMTCFVDEKRHGKADKNCLHVYYSLKYLQKVSPELTMVEHDPGEWRKGDFEMHDMVAWKRN